jgi:tetratricopeptide (TPR) repeat protein
MRNSISPTRLRATRARFSHLLVGLDLMGDGMGFHRSLLAIPLIAALLGTFSACTSPTRVKLDRWHPVEFNVEGVDSLAVLPIRGRREFVEPARSLLLAELAETRFYTLVDEQAVARLTPPPSQHGPQYSTAQAMEQAQRMGIDAVLAAHLERHVDTGADVGMATFRVGDPTVAVQLTYSLIHAPSGQVMKRDKITKRYNGELQETDNAGEPIDKVTHRLTEECIRELAPQIAAHNESFDVALATGGWGEAGEMVNRGNEAAKAGQWKVAHKHWRAAAENDPSCHQALFNLGVAFEQVGDPEGAAYWYGRAVETDDDATYRAALDRVETRRRTDFLARAQLRRQRRRERLAPSQEFAYESGSPPPYVASAAPTIANPTGRSGVDFPLPPAGTSQSDSPRPEIPRAGRHPPSPPYANNGQFNDRFENPLQY